MLLKEDAEQYPNLILQGDPNPEYDLTAGRFQYLDKDGEQKEREEIKLLFNNLTKIFTELLIDYHPIFYSYGGEPSDSQDHHETVEEEIESALGEFHTIVSYHLGPSGHVKGSSSQHVNATFDCGRLKPMFSLHIDRNLYEIIVFFDLSGEKDDIEKYLKSIAPKIHKDTGIQLNGFSSNTIPYWAY